MLSHGDNGLIAMRSQCSRTAITMLSRRETYAIAKIFESYFMPFHGLASATP